MAQIIKVSKAGTNVLTATDPNDLNFSSDYNTFKYADQGTIAVAISGSGTSYATVTHNYGYRPVMFSFTDGGDNFSPKQWKPMPYSFADAGVFTHYFQYAGTQNVVYALEYGSVGAATVNIKWNLFRNNTGL